MTDQQGPAADSTAGEAGGFDRNYAPLRRADLLDDPFAQLEAWVEHARREVPSYEAMTLATVDEAGEPDARMVLLRGYDRAGLRFFTDYDSAKGRQLATTPRAALILYWREQGRQIRARGLVSRTSPEISDEYFATRPRPARLAAWITPQSESISSREELDSRVGEYESRFEGDDVPRPAFWGGYVLEPETIEFFQSQPSRLHDRFLYSREGDAWRIERLTP